eukprot:CAMPEP_0114310632 /NCGR_PEP_ID=MMETSP0059-20121206/19360_1 /TAXON_ID=36894 /ORGANISM="Pyramimonas parkeae, Strain CCMP726" /LENGTH=979 /DNA_ID=CAMNT_0001434683 /DNA_START=138 /DNA_END=3078 /DNA_ORIENTATION=-
MGGNSGGQFAAGGSRTKGKTTNHLQSKKKLQGTSDPNREDDVRDATEKVKDAEKQPGEIGNCDRKEMDTRTHNSFAISHARKSWTDDEHALFLEALARYGRNWKHIQNCIGSKTVIQIRSHAQKYFLKMERTGKAEQVPPPRPKRKSSRPHAKSQENRNKILNPANDPQLERRDRPRKEKHAPSTDKALGEVIGVANGTSATDTGPSESASFPGGVFGSTGDPKFTQPRNARADQKIAEASRLRGHTGKSCAINGARLGDDAENLTVFASIPSAATRSNSLVVHHENRKASTMAMKTIEACDIQKDRDMHSRVSCNLDGDNGKTGNTTQLKSSISASESATIPILGVASGTPAAAAISPPTSGSAPDGSNGSAATSGCGSKTADPQMSDDAEPSGGSGGFAEFSKRSGDSAGQTSNSTGKSETADDTATTVRACTWMNNPTTANVIDTSNPRDPSCHQTDKGIGGDSNGGNGKTRQKRRGRCWQASSVRLKGSQPEWQAVSQHNLVFTLDPRSSGNAEERDGGGSSEGTHEPNHQKRQKRSVSHYNSNCSDFQHEQREDQKQTCGPTSGSDNNDEDSIGSEGTNDQQGQSQTEQQLHVRQSTNQYGLNECNTSHVQDHCSTFMEARKMLRSQADGPSCYPTTPFPQKRPRSPNATTCSNTNNQTLESMENKGEMDSGSADDSLGGITGLSLSFSNNMLMDEDSGPMEAGAVSRNHISCAKMDPIVDQDKTPTFATPLWTMNSQVHHPLHPTHSLKHTQPQQTQSVNSQTCPHRAYPLGNAEMNQYNQPPQFQGSNFQFDTTNFLPERGTHSSMTGWMNTNNVNTYGAGQTLGEQNLVSTSDANFIEVYRMLATHCDPTAEDKQLQQEIGHLHPMEQRTFDVLMGNMCRALMSQEGKGDQLISRNTNFQGSNLTNSTMSSPYQQCLGGQLPIPFTIAESQEMNGGLPQQGSMQSATDQSFDPELTVTFDMHSITQWQNIM